jgi:hypothetical protein
MKEEAVGVGGGEGENELALADLNRYETEESAVFVDYSPESLLEKLREYGSLGIYERHSLAKNIESIRARLLPEPAYLQWLLCIVPLPNPGSRQ